MSAWIQTAWQQARLHAADEAQRCAYTKDLDKFGLSFGRFEYLSREAQDERIAAMERLTGPKKTGMKKTPSVFSVFLFALIGKEVPRRPVRTIHEELAEQLEGFGIDATDLKPREIEEAYGRAMARTMTDDTFEAKPLSEFAQTIRT